MTVTDEKVAKALAGAKIRLVRLRDAHAEDEKATAETLSRARSFRGGAKPISAVRGR